MADIKREALARYLTRIESHSVLDDEERDAVLGLPGRIENVLPRRDLVRPGEHVSDALLVSEGLLCRYDLARSGARQITTFHVPGDLCDLHSVVAPSTGWGISALARSMVVHVPHAAIRQLAREFPSLAFAFWRDTTLDASVLAKCVANIGRKNAQARLAHLFCEMGLRMEQAGLGTRHKFDLPLTQEQIGDALALTAVHVNRMLQTLRATGAIAISHHQVEILDWEALVSIADFSPTYLLPYRLSHTIKAFS